MISLPYITEPNLDVCRVQMDATDFRRALLQHGMPLQWEYAMGCPCKRIQTRGDVVIASDEARSDCPACYGTGIVMGPPQATVGILQDAKEVFKLSTPIGSYTEGDAFISLPPEHIPDVADRYTLKAGARVLNEQRKRTAATVESLRYPVLKRVFDVGNSDKSPGTQRVEYGVLYARFTSTDGVIQVRDLLEGVDFVVTDAGKIDWTIGDAGGTAPVEGAWYSMRYYARPVYRVIGFPFLRRDTFTQDVGQAVPDFAYLPVLVHLTPEFLGHQAVGNEQDPVPNPDTYPTYG
jgi:hypothetical protein